MPLIQSPRLRPEDIIAWERAASRDLAYASTGRHCALVEEAEIEVVRFARGGHCYAGVSWGKDSVVLANMIARLAPEVPLVWVRLDPGFSPECPAVRDAFFDLHPVSRERYLEITTAPLRRADGARLPGSLRRGMSLAEGRFGSRRLSGVRAEESSERRRLVRARGLETENTCMPIARWTGDDIFAYLAARDLPIHPAYAMTFGGSLDRRRLRVSPPGGEPGRGTGRLEWELAYYPEYHV